MNRLADYVLGNPYFKEPDWRDEVKLVSVDELNEPITEYCCGEMAAICAELDGFFYAAENAAEYDQMRRSDYFRELSKQRNEHKCKPAFYYTIKNPVLRERWLKAYQEGA